MLASKQANEPSDYAVMPPLADLQMSKPGMDASLRWHDTPQPATTSAARAATAKITVTPFADIWIDGIQVANNTSSLELSLGVGPHRIVFKHEFAATEERVVNIGSDSKDIRLHVDLEKVKPAKLIILSNVEADIAIDGAYKGTSKETSIRPILIPFPKKTHKLPVEIVVSKNGYLPYIVSHTLIAGKNETLNINLQPER